MSRFATVEDLSERTRRTRPTIARSALTVAVAAMAVLAACGSKDKSTPAATTTTLSPAAKELAKGLAAQGAGKLDAARQSYLAVVSKDPTNKVAYYDLGVVYQQLNDAKSAVEAYNKALAIDPKYQPALFNLGVLLTPTDANAAAGYYRQILALNPNDANVHFNLGLLLRQTGQNAEGNAEVGKALELEPSLASRLPATTTSTPVTTKR